MSVTCAHCGSPIMPNTCPYPFCGGPTGMTQIESTDPFGRGVITEYAVECEKCGATGPKRLTEFAALDDWNTLARKVTKR